MLNLQLRQLLRSFVNRLRKIPDIKTRKRIVKDSDYCKKQAPLLAPRQTRAYYKGCLKDAIIESQSDDAGIGGQVNEEEEENEKEEGGKRSE